MVRNLAQLYRLVSLVAAVDTSHIYQTSVAGSTPTIGGIDYVVSTPAQIKTAVQELYRPVGVRTQATAGSGGSASVPQLPASKIAVAVLNGSGRGGVAGRTVTRLRRAGYRATDGGNAASFSFTTTVVSCDPASFAVARRLAAQLAPAKLEQSTGSSSGRVTVTLGSSFGGRLASRASTSRTQKARRSARRPTTKLPGRPSSTRPQAQDTRATR